jgi:hypothetical protein
MSKHELNPVNALKLLTKDRQKVIDYIRNTVQKSTGKPFFEILTEYPEMKRYYLALHCITTTNKAVCEAMLIPVEAGTRYKKYLQDAGLLVEAAEKSTCPYTGESGVQFYSTNPAAFDELRKTNQLKLFDNE